jgi:hypothetical protein
VSVGTLIVRPSVERLFEEQKARPSGEGADRRSPAHAQNCVSDASGSCNCDRRPRGQDEVSIEPNHEEELEALLDLLRTAVKLEARCGDHVVPAVRDGAATLHTHFADLEPWLEEWDAEVERTQMAVAALWDWYTRAAGARGITEPPFTLGPLVDCLAIRTVERARNGKLRRHQELSIEHLPDRIGGVERMNIYVEGQRVAGFPRPQHDDVEQPAYAFDHLIQALFDDAQRSDEARAIDRARDSLLAHKRRLLRRLAEYAADARMRYEPGCRICRIEHELEAARWSRHTARQRG